MGEGAIFQEKYITANTFFSFCELCFSLIFSSLTLHLTFTVDNQVITLTICIPPRYTEPWSNTGIIINDQPTMYHDMQATIQYKQGNGHLLGVIN